jgi:hypothetical protein
MSLDVRAKLARMARDAHENPRGAALALGAALAVAALGVGGYVSGSGRFSADRAKAIKDESTYRAALVEIRDERARRGKLDAQLQSFVDRTLGGTAETCDAQLRSRLNRLGEEVGLRDLRVTTGSAASRTSPAKAEFGRSGRDRALRDEVDFIELDASIGGEGSLEQVLRLVHRIEVEPWIKRIDGVKLDAVGEGERVKLSLRLTTLFLPGLDRKLELKVADSELAGFARVASLVDANPFRVPKPPAVTAVAAVDPPSNPPTVAPVTDPAATEAPPTGFPYDQWLLTGLVSGPTGQEAWLRNSSDNRSAILQPGQSMGGITFLGFTADIADFVAGESKFRVQVGTSLGSRLPPA